ncbi:hypothetical protein KGF57_002365 [Candida theae]|uniref:Uncharacterized protein n=1 Tax=Candida theae TaxID=1198502 RepID=A0AAD5BFV8_9ASCO|nr:uncharacterized protein KGF57_002365 [Candida theae]KAI5958931.1 hypothetical protein KGF57_002365 [Candida theae]
MTPNDHNRQDRKRKRTHRIPRPASNSSNSVPPSSASSSYIPSQSQTLELCLTNKSLKREVVKSSVDDTKLIHFLSKLNPREVISVNENQSHVTLIISSFETNLLQIPAIKHTLVEKFQIDDVLATEGPPGSIDVLVTVYGKMVDVAKAVNYLIFLLNANINNLQKDVFTLKSSTYKAHLLLRNCEDQQNVKYIDTAQSFTYDYNRNIHDVFVQGDLTSLFNFVLHCLEKKWNIDPSAVQLKPMFGIHLDPALKVKPKINEDIKSKAQSNLLSYLYSKQVSEAIYNQT